MTVQAAVPVPACAPPCDASLSPVYGFLKNPSMVDFEGHLAAVFFLSGCNFNCGFCHNAELMAANREGLSWERLEQACRRFADNWVTGAVITGGEPTLSPALPDLIEFLRGFGWAIKLDSNGSNPGMLRRCLDRVDYVAMDVKTSPDHYPEFTGFHAIDRLHESIELIRNDAPGYEFRTTILDGVHSSARMDELGQSIAVARRYVLQPFVPSDRLPSPALRTHPRTSPHRLQRLAQRMKPYAHDVQIRGS